MPTNESGPELISTAQATRLVEKWTGRRGGPQMVWRWITKGLLGPYGERLRLKGYRVGRRWLTTEHDLRELFERLAQEHVEHHQAKLEGPRQTPGQLERRRREKEQARRRLEEAGIRKPRGTSRGLNSEGLKPLRRRGADDDEIRL